MAHHRQKLGLGPAGGDGLGLGQRQVAGQGAHLLGPLAVQGRTRLNHLQRRADADVAAVRHHDEARQQGAQFRRVVGVEEGLGAGRRLRHRRIAVHQAFGGLSGIQGASELGRHPQGEGVAFDDAEGAAIVIDDSQGQGVRLGLEPFEHIGARRGRGHRRDQVDEITDQRHQDPRKSGGLIRR